MPNRRKRERTKASKKNEERSEIPQACVPSSTKRVKLLKSPTLDNKEITEQENKMDDTKQTDNNSCFPTFPSNGNENDKAHSIQVDQAEEENQQKPDNQTDGEEYAKMDDNRTTLNEILDISKDDNKNELSSQHKAQEVSTLRELAQKKLEQNNKEIDSEKSHVHFQRILSKESAIKFDYQESAMKSIEIENMESKKQDNSEAGEPCLSLTTSQIDAFIRCPPSPFSQLITPEIPSVSVETSRVMTTDDEKQVQQHKATNTDKSLMPMYQDGRPFLSELIRNLESVNRKLIHIRKEVENLRQKKGISHGFRR